jgi:hypothetical protein
MSDQEEIRNLFAIKKVDPNLFLQLLSIIEEQIIKAVLPENTTKEAVKMALLELVNACHPKTTEFIQGIASLGQQRLIELGSYRLLLDYVNGVEELGAEIKSPERVLRKKSAPIQGAAKPERKTVKAVDANASESLETLSRTVSFPDAVDDPERLLRKPMKPRAKDLTHHWSDLEKKNTEKYRMLEFLIEPRGSAELIEFARGSLKGRLDKVEKFLLQMSRGLHAHRGWTCRTSDDGVTVSAVQLSEAQVDSYVAKTEG